jgi:hypothetical protein
MTSNQGSQPAPGANAASAASVDMPALFGALIAFVLLGLYVYAIIRG